MPPGSAPPGLLLPRAAAEAALVHARAELPNEACGLLAGRRGPNGVGRVTTFFAARNIEASPSRYNVHPEDLVRIVYAIERAGEDLVAIFHSHTRTAAEPSAIDRRTARYDLPFYLVASLLAPEAPPESALRAWRIMGGHTFEVPLRVVG
ncbi:MAG: M67 family metallopeptidase [Chloroflexota bacterium]